MEKEEGRNNIRVGEKRQVKGRLKKDSIKLKGKRERREVNVYVRKDYERN